MTERLLGGAGQRNEPHNRGSHGLAQRKVSGSSKTEVEWPPYRPDLNHIFFFWSYAMIHVRQQKPTTIDDLKETVKDVASTLLKQMIRDAVANLCKRCKACVLADGDHFEPFLKYV